MSGGPPDPFDPQPFPGLPDHSEADRLKRSKDHRTMMATRRTIRDFSDQPVARAVIEEALRTAGGAPSGANKQPWHFCVVSDRSLKRQIREAAEAEERAFYDGKASQEWLDDLAPLGTDPNKPFLETAPYLIVVFQQNYGLDPEKGTRQKHYYVHESVGLACGFLLTALHNAGLATLTHTPNPMGFLRDLLDRPSNEKAVMIIVTGHAAANATVPKAALTKKSLGDFTSWF
ncbi:MAG: nitroreductase family protein [Pseudomonadota bacterium]